MSQIPAGWYDDPEYPDHHRYWDGTSWTDHRAPKAGGGPLVPRRRSAWSLVPDTFGLLGRRWREFVVLALPLLVFSLSATVLVVAAVDAALDPGLQTIIDRVTEPGFDPDDPADEAFLDAITFDVGGGFLGLVLIGALLLVVASFVTPIAIARFALGAHHERPPSPATAIAMAVRRAPRMLGLALVIALVAVAAIVATVVLAVLSPLTLVFTLPALFVAGLWAVPLVSYAGTVVAAGPDGAPTWPTAFGLQRNRWWATAGRLLIIAVLVVAVSIGFGVVIAPVTAASFWGGMIANTLAQTVQTVIGQVAWIHVYLWADGPVDPRLTTDQAS